MTRPEVRDALRRLRSFRLDPQYQGPERELITDALISTLIHQLRRHGPVPAVALMGEALRRAEAAAARAMTSES